MSSAVSNELAKAKNAVFRLLKYRSRSRKELQDRLRHKKFSENTINQAIVYFDSLDLIDDQAFAVNWLNSRLSRPLGLRRIFFELKRKGISKDILDGLQAKLRDNYN